MRFFRYYYRLLQVAVTHSLDLTQGALIVVLMVLGVVSTMLTDPQIVASIAAFMASLATWQAAMRTLGVIVGIRLLLAPFWVHQDAEKKIADLCDRLDAAPIKQNTLHHALKIEFEQVEPFMRRTVFPTGTARYEVYVRITNAGNGFLSECSVSVPRITKTKDDTYNILGIDQSLARGEHRYVLVAGFNDDIMGTQVIYNKVVTFAFASGGIGVSHGFTTIDPPTASDPAIVTIEVKALECQTERKDFKLWVSDTRRLHMAEIP